MAKSIKGKRKGMGLEIRTFEGDSGATYIVFKLPQGKGKYHAFREVEAKEAARDCGANLDEGHTRDYWATRWNEKSKR